MNRFEQIYEEEKSNGISIVKDALSKEADLFWEDLYWISKSLYVYGSGTIDDKEVIFCLDKTFSKGLNYHTNSDLYLDAAQMMARLYMKYKRYDEAINFLMSIDELSENVLDWVHLYYAMAQVMSDNIVRIAQKPKFFFERLDKVSEKSLSKRNEVFITYLQRIKDCITDGTITDYAKDLVDSKTTEYGLTNRWQTISTVTESEEEEDFPESNEEITKKKEPSTIQTVEVKVVDETKIKELEAIINAKDSEISELKGKILDLEKQISSLVEENQKLKAESSNKDKALTQIRTSIQEQQTESEEPTVNITEFDNNGHALLNRYQTNQKILVIGAIAGNALDQLKLRAKHKGFEVEKDFEFITDYDKITNITGQLNYSRYAAIIAGPMGHSAAGNDGYSSFIEMLKGEGYPTLYEAKTESGKLKLNQSSFERALQKFISYLLVM